jgi:hypothetical protein
MAPAMEVTVNPTIQNTQNCHGILDYLLTFLVATYEALDTLPWDSPVGLDAEAFEVPGPQKLVDGVDMDTQSFSGLVGSHDIRA